MYKLHAFLWNLVATWNRKESKKREREIERERLRVSPPLISLYAKQIKRNIKRMLIYLWYNEVYKRWTSVYREKKKKKRKREKARANIVPNYLVLKEN